MEKRISYSQFQQVKAAAKMIDPNVRKMDAIKKKIQPLVEELKSLQSLNDSLEAGIVSVLGFHVAELVKKVIEPTGKTDAKTGKPIMVTKYLPTDVVSYDEQKKQYVIHIPSSDEINTGIDAAVAEGHTEVAKDAEALETHEEESEREAAEAEAGVWPLDNQ